MSVVGVVLAGGAGHRAGLGGNKVLARLGERTVLGHAVAAVGTVVDEVVVVARPDERADVDRALGDERPTVVEIVDGGPTRHDSEAAGIAVAARLGAETVAVHDAARPLVPTDLVRRVVVAARAGVAVVPGLPRDVPLARWPDPDRTVVDVDSLLSRPPLIGVQTPQAAPVELLRECVAAVAAHGDAAAQLDTVEPVLRHRPDVPVVAVAGAPANLKVTWPADLDRVAHLLEHGVDGAARRGLRRRPGWPTGGPPHVALEVDGVAPVTDALRRVEDGRVVAAVDRRSLVDVTGDLLATPGTIDDTAPDLAAAVEAAVTAGATLRLRRRR